jgi:ABC-type uncharacterized transport system involved in gliding motility auxiliary subunit
MNSKLRRFAPLGLVLAGLASLTAIVIYFIQREWNIYLQVSIGLVVIGLALFTILDPERVRKILTGRQARHGSNVLVLSLAFIGIILVINFLALNNPWRKDLTEDQEHTLAVETLDILDKLDSEVFATAFFTPRVPSDEAYEILELYKFHSNGKFDFEFVDPEANPLAAEQAKISRDGTVVIKMDDHQEAVSFINEQEITAALVRLISPEERKVYFLTGHGEYDPEISGEEGFSQVKRTLESKNYSVEKLSLLTTNQIPDDASILIIAGPINPISASEVERIRDFLRNGGSLLIMQEPPPLTEFEDQPDVMADFLKDEWGITFGEDIIIDLNSMQLFAPFAGEYGQHIITSKLENISSQYPTVRSVTVNSSDVPASRVDLVKTGGQSWAETDLEGIAENPEGASFEEDKDLAGPVSLAVAAEDFETQSRLVAFGDSDFANDSNYFAYANGDLLINSVDWLTGQEDIINLTPKNSTLRNIIPLQPMALNIILLVTVILIPGLALLAGIYTWFNRRQRG